MLLSVLTGFCVVGLAMAYASVHPWTSSAPGMSSPSTVGHLEDVGLGRGWGRAMRLALLLCICGVFAVGCHRRTRVLQTPWSPDERQWPNQGAGQPGYPNSDLTLERAIASRLGGADGQLEDVRCHVTRGVAVCRGRVASVELRRRAVILAQDAGARAVVDLVSVAARSQPTPPGDGSVASGLAATDRAIARAIEDAWYLDPRVSAFSPIVTVDAGAVTLTGHVASARARLAAEEDARDAKGVRSVENELEIERSDPP